MSRPHPSSRVRGFTLVEAVATMAIIAVIGVVSSRAVMAGVDAYGAAAVRAQLAGEMSAAMERIAAELRTIPVRAGVEPAEPDLDSLSAVAVSWGDDNALSLSGGQLMLTVNGQAAPLMADVTNLSIQAFDHENQPLAADLSGDACDAVRRIAVTLTASRGGVTETLRMRVFLRSMATGAAPETPAGGPE